MVKFDKVDLDTKFANWNGWYNDLFEEIKNIRNIGGTMLLSPKDNIHRYYSGLINLYSTHSQYIKQHDRVYKRLTAVKEKIYSAKFHRDLKLMSVPLDVINTITEMIIIFTWINKSFSEHGIIPKVTATRERDPGKAMSEAEY